MRNPLLKPAASLEIEHGSPAGQNFQAVLDGRRAVYLPGCKSLLVADLHWGKGETFRKHGIPIPDAVLLSDLRRLSELIDAYQPQRLLVLGDLIHGAAGLTEGLDHTILEWRADYGLPMVLIAGNHDRCIEKVADRWGVRVIQENVEESPFSFSHEQLTGNDFFNWSGHVHPAVRLAGRVDSMRLPCFHFNRYGATLPAFSEFTGGFNIQPNAEDRVFAISDGLVIPV
jgi:DNA ligase-associated metallophosphoesterase